MMSHDLKVTSASTGLIVSVDNRLVRLDNRLVRLVTKTPTNTPTPKPAHRASVVLSNIIVTERLRKINGHFFAPPSPTSQKFTNQLLIKHFALLLINLFFVVQVILCIFSFDSLCIFLFLPFQPPRLIADVPISSSPSWRMLQWFLLRLFAQSHSLILQLHCFQQQFEISFDGCG